MERVSPKKPLTPMQWTIATLVGINMPNADIATELHITRGMVRWHLNRIAERLPGDLPAKVRVMAWARGATIDVLEGRTLRFEFMRDAQLAGRASPTAHSVGTGTA
jgi:hypothetical protein